MSGRRTLVLLLSKTNRLVWSHRHRGNSGGGMCRYSVLVEYRKVEAQNQNHRGTPFAGMVKSRVWLVVSDMEESPDVERQ